MGDPGSLYQRDLNWPKWTDFQIFTFLGRGTQLVEEAPITYFQFDIL
jgi:hypothetical protein